MPKEYFVSERQKKLQEIGKDWLGVPYHHMGYTRGGVDCTKFVGLVCVDLGILKDIEKDVYYPRDWYRHGQKEIVLESVEKYGKELLFGLRLVKYEFGQIFTPSPIVGDLFCLAVNNTGICNHTAIYIDTGKIIHCLQRKGVIISDFQSWQKKIKYLYRIFEE